MQRTARIDKAAHAYNTMLDMGVIDDAPVRNNSVIDLRAVDFRRRQKTRTGKNRRAHIEEIKLGQHCHEVKIGLEEISDGSNIFPVTLEDVGIEPVGVDRAGNDVL